VTPGQNVNIYNSTYVLVRHIMFTPWKYILCGHQKRVNKLQ